MKRSLTLCLTLCLAIACGESADPSVNNTTNNNPTPTDMGNDTPDQPVTPTDMNNMTPDMPDMPVTPTDMPDMMNPTACAVSENFKGQIGGRKDNDGGVYATDDSSYAADSGLAAAWTLLDGYKAGGKFPDNDPATMGNDECNVEIAVPTAEQVQVTGARVTGVFYSKMNGARVIVQDKQRGLLLFLPPAVAPDGATADSTSIKVGQTINFKITGVKRFACSTPQVSNISGFEITAENQPVYVKEMTGQDVTIADYMKVVKIGGALTNFSMCGTTGRCFVMEHGPDGAKKTINYRSTSNFLDAMDNGKCATFVGPLGAFPDVFAATAENPAVPQLNSDNFDWTSYIE